MHTYHDDIGPIFGRVDATGNVRILYAASGEPVTRLDSSVRPVGSDLGARNEHPEGITLTAADARALGVPLED